MKSYDLVIVGGGPGGYTAALRAAQRGATVCLIEQARLGGTCLNLGCIPAKAMLHLSDLTFRAKTARDLGLKVDDARVDGDTLAEHVAAVTAKLRAGVAGLLDARKVDVIQGRGRFITPKRIEISGAAATATVEASSVIIATGAHPVRPGFVPWKSPRVMTTDEATVAAEIPRSILILGGGVIGCELATFYAELGAPTVLVEQADRLLPALDADAARAVTRSLKDRGVHVRTGTTAEAMTADAESVTTDLSCGQRVITHAALVAVGRTACVDNLGLDAAGIGVVDGLIPVDAQCRTRAEGVYAVGDVASRKQYAHVASRMGIVAADTITGHPAAEDLSCIPECAYTHPEVASVGLGEDEATRRFDDVKVARFFAQAGGLAQACNQTDGSVKLIARRKSGAILGAVLVAPRATEMIASLVLAMRCGLSVQQVADAVWAHPTFSECIHEAAEAWLDLPIHKLR